MLSRSIRGFTLIELLVVITIIGILATGAVAVYTSQIQKARDTVRISDIGTIQKGLEMWYNDKALYPDTTAFTGIVIYAPKIPKDAKSGQPCSAGTNGSGGTACDYIYTVIQDTNGILNGTYKLSSGFEDKGNVDTRAVNTKDGGSDDTRYEIGLELTRAQNDTKCGRSNAVTPPTNFPALTAALCPGGLPANAAGVIIITGN